MEQHSLRLQYRVGLFIGTGLFVIMMSILLLGGDKIFFTKYVALHIRFDEVQGLFPGSVVSLAGVQVGNVKTIRFIEKESRLDIEMKIDAIYRNRLVAGTKGEIKTQGALGDKFIYLTPGPLDGKLLANGSIIEGDDTDYMKLLTSREDGAARIIDLIKDTQVLIASINGNGKAAELMRNMADASGKLKSTMTELSTLTASINANIPENKKIKSAMISLASILEKVDQGKGTLGLLINDPSVYQSLKAFAGGSPRNRYMKDVIRETIQKSEAN